VQEGFGIMQTVAFTETLHIKKH